MATVGVKGLIIVDELLEICYYRDSVDATSWRQQCSSVRVNLSPVSGLCVCVYVCVIVSAWCQRKFHPFDW